MTIREVMETEDYHDVHVEEDCGDIRLFIDDQEFEFGPHEAIWLGEQLSKLGNALNKPG